jgi:hypothetical protein
VTFLRTLRDGTVVIVIIRADMRVLVAAVAATLLMDMSRATSFTCYDEDADAESYLLGGTCADINELSLLVQASGGSSGNMSCTTYDFGSGDIHFTETPKCHAVNFVKFAFEAFQRITSSSGLASSIVTCDANLPFLVWPTPAKCRSTDPLPYLDSGRLAGHVFLFYCMQHTCAAQGVS